MDLHSGERLSGRHDFHGVDIHMGGQGRGPEYRFGDIIAR
jgi:hypothetical protein